MKDFCIAVAYCNQTEHLKDMMRSCLQTAASLHEIILLDNGSTEKYTLGAYGNETVFLKNKKNEGIFKPYNQIIEKSKSEWVGFFHNDIIFHEDDWDKRVIETVTMLEGEGKKIGIVGFAGSRGGDAIGARVGFASNLRDVAEIHGKRMTGYMPATFLDGAVLICNKEMLNKVGGFDQSFKGFHIYDYVMSLDSISAGYHNLVIGIDFTHKGGITGCSADGQKYFNKLVGTDKELFSFREKLKKTHPRITAEQTVMEFNIQQFRKKYVNKGYLPYYITQDWRVSHDITRI